MNKLSLNLKSFLLSAKISENELARRTGIAQQVINRILSGENTNPKISTLSPLANYFMVSISQLIGDEIVENATRLNTNHLGWQEIPKIDINLLDKKSLKELITESEEKILVDINPFNNVFALSMNDNSMEPKFPNGTILIFDPNKKPENGNFVLFKTPENTIEIRQIIIKNNKIYKKSLNPTHKNYQPSLLTENVIFLGLLIQSRTNYSYC